MRLKIELYILSLSSLFILLFINNININFSKIIQEEINYIPLLTINLTPIVCLIGIIYSIYIYFFRFKDYIIDSSKIGPWKIIKIESLSFENLGFLATFIIPLLCFDLDFHLDQDRNALMLILVLVVIGLVYIKSNLYFTNPTLALLDFKIYRISYVFQNEEKSCTVISKDKIQFDDMVFAKIIDENIYYIRRVKK